jgi:hypothetical protein
LWKLGERTEAERLLSESERICQEKVAAGDQRYGLREVMAMVHALRGNSDEALRWLEQAIEEGWRWYDVVASDPVWENLRGEPRFQQSMAAVEAEVESMRRRIRVLEQEWGWDERGHR